MTSTPTQAAPAAPAPAAPAPAAQQQNAPGQEEREEGGWGGRVLDGLGIVAGVVLVAIIIDIFSDGRLISRRLGRGRDDGAEVQADAPEGGPA